MCCNDMNYLAEPLISQIMFNLRHRNVALFIVLCFVVTVMRSISWCAPSHTMARTCLNRSSPREWAHTKVSSTTSNGMNCKWLPLRSPPPHLYAIFKYLKPQQQLTYLYYSSMSLLTLCSLVIPRINFPIAVAVLPLESTLSLTLFGVLNQNASGSPDSNKQRKAPELLGKVSMPLFDFRR